MVVPDIIILWEAMEDRGEVVVHKHQALAPNLEELGLKVKMGVLRLQNWGVSRLGAVVVDFRLPEPQV